MVLVVMAENNPTVISLSHPLPSNLLLNNKVMSTVNGSVFTEIGYSYCFIRHSLSKVSVVAL